MTTRSLLLAVAVALRMQAAIATEPSSPVSQVASQSCMAKWLKVFVPSLSTDAVGRREQTFLQALQPVDEGNAASSAVQGWISLSFHGLRRARDFANCLSARTPEKCANQAPCQHGGKCLFSSKSRVGAATRRAYACECPEGFAGKFCQTALSACPRRPCQNKGVCQSLSSGRFKCVCPPHYSGRLCGREWLSEQMLNELVSSVRTLAKAVKRQDQTFTASRTGAWQRTASFLRAMENRLATKTRYVETRLATKTRNMEARLEKEIDDRFASIMANVSTLVAHLKPSPGRSHPAPSVGCHPVTSGTESVSKIYTHTVGNTSFNAMCNMTVDGGGWTMLMRSSARRSTTFAGKTWESYKNGFGRMAFNDFWLGNEKAHLITSSQRHELRVDVRTIQGVSHFFKYDVISIGSDAEKYTLLVGNLTGSSTTVRPGQGMRYHSGMKFSTIDQDNDIFRAHCATFYGGRCGWWYRNCAIVFPYSRYAKFSNDIINLEYFDMKIRPVSRSFD